MKSVLVVGCGYLGLRVATLLHARGDRVFATTRKQQRLVELRRLNIEPVLFDVLTPTTLPQTDVVVHAVGLDRSAGVPMRTVYVDGLRNVLACRNAPRFVHVSSTSVYGQSDGEWIDEQTPTEPRDESGRIVREAETLLTTDAVVLRFAGIYGPGRLIGAVGLRAGKPIAGDPNGWLNLIHVADGANAVVAAIDRGQGVYNVADGSPVLRCDFYSYLAELIGAGFPTFSPIGDAPNRRINARRMREDLGIIPCFADYRAGLLAAYHEEYERS